MPTRNQLIGMLFIDRSDVQDGVLCTMPTVHLAYRKSLPHFDCHHIPVLIRQVDAVQYNLTSGQVEGRQYSKEKGEGTSSGWHGGAWKRLEKTEDACITAWNHSH